VKPKVTLKNSKEAMEEFIDRSSADENRKFLFLRES
jgi:hypothetical protein